MATINPSIKSDLNDQEMRQSEKMGTSMTSLTAVAVEQHPLQNSLQSTPKGGGARIRPVGTPTSSDRTGNCDFS